MKKISIDDIELQDKRVLVRVDFNVPLSDGKVVSDVRIRAALPTINKIINSGGTAILMSHLGKPKGKVKPEYSLKPVAAHLSGLINKEVVFINDCIGEEVEKKVAELKKGSIALLENLRFHAGEEENDFVFAEALGKLGDAYVNDAFGTAHRAHASTAGIPTFLPSGLGYLMQKEVESLGKLLEEPERPFIAILGGAKVSDKIGLIKNLMVRVDSFLIGGAMAYTFLKAKGQKTGASRVEEDKISVAKETLAAAEADKKTFILPVDHVLGEKFEDNTSVSNAAGDIPDGKMGLDIGTQTVSQFCAEIARAKTILWNGPSGVFEWANFSNGTMKIAEAVAEATKKGAFTVCCGGDTVSAVEKFGVADKVSYISTGGGASLEFLEGKELPGIAAISDKE
ncbi:MAG: phosphoglycerate kinase [Planctomycetota bacterium]